MLFTIKLYAQNVLKVIFSKKIWEWCKALLPNTDNFSHEICTGNVFEDFLKKTIKQFTVRKYLKDQSIMMNLIKKSLENWNINQMVTKSAEFVSDLICAANYLIIMVVQKHFKILENLFYRITKYKNDTLVFRFVIKI